MHIFWPAEDLDVLGIAYGWRKQTSTVVAGVLVGERADAEAALARFMSSQNSGSSPVTRHLVVLGSHAPSRSRNASPFSGFDTGQSSASNPISIFYRRSEMGFARFQSSRAQGGDTPSSFSGTKNTLRPSPLDPTVLAQLNATYRVHHVLSKRSPHTSNTRALYGSAPTAFLLHVAGALSAADGAADGSLSSLLEQVHHRAALLRSMAIQASAPQTPEETGAWASRHRFGNALWLTLNDLVLGIIIGRFVIEHRVALGSILGSVFMTVFVDFVRQALSWLDSWPAGLKLNTELSHFLCKALTSTTDLWADSVKKLAPHFPHLVHAAGLLAFGGLTLSIALFLDVLALLTLPATLSYRVLSAVLRVQFAALSSLWNLFRGKRYNMLHRHVDSFNYELDQLLLGTLLFTLLTFSVPTFAAYALLFILMRALVVCATFLVQLLLRAMNEFPLFALLLRIKDQRRLPGLIYLRPSAAEPHTLNLAIERTSFHSLISSFGPIDGL